MSILVSSMKSFQDTIHLRTLIPAARPSSAPLAFSLGCLLQIMLWLQPVPPALRALNFKNMQNVAAYALLVNFLSSAGQNSPPPQTDSGVRTSRTSHACGRTQATVKACTHLTYPHETPY